VVVVLSSGSPVLLPWLDAVPSVLEAYLPGSAVGEALADVLFGVAAPGGRLAETFPLKVEDTPSFWNFPGFGDTVEYREGILVGYRWYDTRRMDVLFPFGHGLSYTTFSYSDLTVSKPSLTEDETVEVSFSVTNTGVRAGCEVAQLYLSHPETAVGRAAKELKGFYKVRLAPGASERVTLPLDRRSFAFYDSSTGNWAVEAGPVAISVGASSRDLRLTDTVRVEGRYLPAVRFTLNSSRDFLLSHPASAPVFGLFFARMGSMFGRVSNDVDEDDGMARMMETMSAQMPLRAIVLFSAGRLSEEMLRPLLDQCNENMKASKP
jgi:beta-glucosidase